MEAVHAACVQISGRGLHFLARRGQRLARRNNEQTVQPIVSLAHVRAHTADDSLFGWGDGDLHCLSFGDQTVSDPKRRRADGLLRGSLRPPQEVSPELPRRIYLAAPPPLRKARCGCRRRPARRPLLTRARR